MNQFFTVAQVVMPIFVAIFLGILAKKKALISAEGVAGMQQFVMQFGLPCVVFNSCYSADIGAESLTSMGLVLPCVLAATFWSYHARKKQFPYHNFPQLFAAQETGMLGIPLFMILFGAEQAYRVGILDLTQAVAAFPTIALLSANTGENPTPMQIAKKSGNLSFADYGSSGPDIESNRCCPVAGCGGYWRDHYPEYIFSDPACQRYDDLQRWL